MRNEALHREIGKPPSLSCLGFSGGPRAPVPARRGPPERGVRVADPLPRPVGGPVRSPRQTPGEGTMTPKGEDLKSKGNARPKQREDNSIRGDENRTSVSLVGDRE